MIRRFGRLAYPSEVQVRGTKVARIPLTNEVDALESRLWIPNIQHALDQGSLGSCTGNAVAQCASTQPFGLQLTEEDALRAYELATQIDDIPGQYPPVDTGSSGWAAMTAAVQLGWFAGFERADSVYQILLALQTGPGVAGTDWYRGDDSPDGTGLVIPTGVIRGGHEYMIAGCVIARLGTGALDLEYCRIITRNSWGDDYGVTIKYGVPIETATGYFSHKLPHFMARLATFGDAHFPRVP